MIFDRLKSLRPRNLRLGSKLMITYLLITAIPLAILGTISYAQYADSVERQAGEYMPKFLEQANADIDKRLAALADMPERLFASEKILSILRSGGSQSISDYNRDATRMNSFLADAFVNGSNPEVLGAYILSSQRLFHSAKWVFQEKDWEWQLRRYAGQEAKPDEMRLILPGELKLHFANKIPYAMIKKTILDADNRKVLGSMFIAVDLSFIDGIFRQFNADDQASIWYMNEAGVIIYSGDRERIGTVDEEKSHYPVGSGSFRTRGGGGELISVNESPLGLTLAHSVPVRRLLAGVDKVRDATLAVFFGIIVVTSAVSAYLSWRFIRPLKKLGGLMKNVEMGHFEVDYSLQSPDEIGSLARSLNSMIETIRDLIQKNYQIEIRQKEAELYALQSQINPHFMYNTLETIGMAVEDGEKEAVVDMVTLLGRMLRFSVSNSSKSVLIAEELQHVRDYLAIQKFRFEGRLSYEIAVHLREWTEQQLYAPKFILQPLVENAIKHGLEKKRQLDIQLTISQEFGARSGKEDIVFRLRDNGPGIPAERLTALEQSLQDRSIQPKGSQFGLSNVNSRIAMLHGEEYGLQLHSIEGLGTEIIVRIPVELSPPLSGGAAQKEESSS